MKIDHHALTKISHLARLEVKPEEMEATLKSMDSVLTWMEQLNNVDTEGVEPLTHIMEEVNNWREDQSTNALSRDEALANAPSKNNIYIMVPKVLD